MRKIASFSICITAVFLLCGCDIQTPGKSANHYDYIPNNTSSATEVSSEPLSAGVYCELAVTSNKAPSSSSEAPSSSPETSFVTEAPEPCRHTSTVIKNKKSATEAAAGYTGDTYCKSCGVKLKSGTAIPKIIVPSVNSYNVNGTIIDVPKTENPFLYTLKLSNKKADGLYPDIVTEIFNRVNDERKKAGLAPLTLLTEAEYFAEVRAKEALKHFSHSRPADANHNTERLWDTVYSDYNVIISGSDGENIAYTYGNKNADTDYIFDMWMNSAGHKANILSDKYKYISIGVTAGQSCIDGRTADMMTYVQNFFG